MYDRIMERNPTMFMMPNPNEATGRFVLCNEPGCSRSSGVAEFSAMTLRSGFSYCLDHMKRDELASRASVAVDYSNMTLIFYDLELSRDGEIEQIGAWSDSNKNFSSVVRTTVRTNTSPHLRVIPPAIWAAFVAEPAAAIRDFISWINRTHYTNTHGDVNPNNIMLAAHNGGCHDHVRILRMMLKHGVDPPNYKFVDTLVMFKVIKGKDMPASLSALRDMYAPWITHTPHDADSDAEVLRYLTMYVFPDVKRFCHIFSIDCEEYSNRTGMNMYLPSPVVTIMPRTSSRPCTPPNYQDDIDSDLSCESVD